MEDVKWLEDKIERAKELVKWEERRNHDKLYESDSCKKDLDNLEVRLALSKMGVSYEVKSNNQLLILNQIYLYTWTMAHRKKGDKNWLRGSNSFYSILDELMYEYKKDNLSEVEEAYYEWVMKQPKSMRGSFVQFEAGYNAGKLSK